MKEQSYMKLRFSETMDRLQVHTTKFLGKQWSQRSKRTDPTCATFESMSFLKMNSQQFDITNRSESFRLKK